ncbi:BadF/BadG/BcrA/BcrD ATPase family protein [Nonomuraea sp. NPDC050691]|uniref:BadF/BadG/BcrA/BcrD ATPase family protein n=1 Tax=Nonomuraea sp. NPDC050691 TaxID=3155661 RepID=UPI0033ED151B
MLAGTGAAAARFSDRAVAAVADGLGWLLGDEGGGFWIGRAGVRAAVHALDRGLPYGPLVELVSAHFGVTGEPRRRADRIVRLAQADRMLVAAASPLVTEAAAAGDGPATEIADEAARRLAATAGRVLGDGPIVLAGGVLAADGPVRTAVTTLLGGHEVVTARDGAGGASWLAALDQLGDLGTHARFTAGDRAAAPR